MATTKSERIEFTGGTGARLAARLDLPAGTPRAYAVFAHCFTCSKDIAAASRIARALAAAEIGVLRFDFTGIGHSDGEFANTNFSSDVGDLVAACEWMRAEGMPPSLLIGHSLGGAAVLSAAGRVVGIRAVASIGAPADPSHVQKLFVDAGTDIDAKGEAEVELGGRRFTITKQFVDDLNAQTLDDTIAKLRCAILVMHAPLDNVVGIDNASKIFLAAKHPKSFVSLDNADHLLSGAGDARYAAGVISAWAERYLPARDPAIVARAKPDEVVVVENAETPFGNAIAAGPHAMNADEPPAVGGRGTGPTPYDLLLAGLGACTSMTMRMYARRKELPLDRVTVRLKHSKIHAQDCADCETDKGKVDLIERTIKIEGDLTDGQRDKLMMIADRCPVHRTLHSEVKVRTEPET